MGRRSSWAPRTPRSSQRTRTPVCRARPNPHRHDVDPRRLEVLWHVVRRLVRLGLRLDAEDGHALGGEHDLDPARDGRRSGESLGWDACRAAAGTAPGKQAYTGAHLADLRRVCDDIGVTAAARRHGRRTAQPLAAARPRGGPCERAAKRAELHAQGWKGQINLRSRPLTPDFPCVLALQLHPRVGTVSIVPGAKRCAGARETAECRRVPLALWGGVALPVSASCSLPKPRQVSHYSTPGLTGPVVRRAACPGVHGYESPSPPLRRARFLKTRPNTPASRFGFATPQTLAYVRPSAESKARAKAAAAATCQRFLRTMCKSGGIPAARACSPKAAGKKLRSKAVKAG